MGGVKTDLDGATAVPGLYAAGEVACVSVHGGNRLGANSLLDTIVFGRRAGKAAAAYAARVPRTNGDEMVLAAERSRIAELLARPYQGETHAGIRLELGTLMDAKVGVYRDEAGLKAALSKLAELRARYDRVAVGDKGRVFNQALTFVLEVGYLLDCAEAVTRSALVRKESRGAHARTDFPQRDDEAWLKHIVVTHRAGGEPDTSYLPVTITRWKPEVRVY
jgi:succinate dehydrogenase / fumarate reductase flavoprotein subunit